MREMLAEVRGTAFDLEWADQLSSGLERLAAGGIDAVLLDLSLPDSQGFDTFVKTHTQAAQVPIIVLSGLDDEELAGKAVREGAQDYLVKGNVDSNLLVRALRYAVERKKAEEAKAKLEAQLRQAQKMEAIGTLAGGIAHDFNNILGAIFGYTELTMNDLPEDSLARANLDEVLKATRRAKDLVKQILTFSRQTEQKRMPLQIHFIVKEVLKLLRASLPTTIEIRQNIDTRDGVVLADPTEIHQVVMNLCTNAYHAMRQNGSVLEVSLRNVDCGLRNADLEKHHKHSAFRIPHFALRLTA